MKVIKNRQIENIDWEFSEQIVSDGNLIFPYEIYAENRESLFSRNGKTGVILNGEIPVEKIVNDLNKLDLIALDFPKYVDGRCFSYARLLRDAYHYTGDILATGDILRDQVAHLERCGVNIIKMTDHRDNEDALKAFYELTTPYQVAADKIKTINQIR